MAGYDYLEGAAQGINRGIKGYQDARRFQSDERRRAQVMDSFESQKKRQEILNARQDEEAAYSKSQRGVNENNQRLSGEATQAQLDLSRQQRQQGVTKFKDEQADRVVATQDKALKDKKTKKSYSEEQTRNNFAQTLNMYNLTGDTEPFRLAYNELVDDQYDAQDIIKNPDGTVTIVRTDKKTGEPTKDTMSEAEYQQVMEAFATKPSEMISKLQKARTEGAKKNNKSSLEIAKWQRTLKNDGIDIINDNYKGVWNGMEFVFDDSKRPKALNAMAILSELRLSNERGTPEGDAQKAIELSDKGIWPNSKGYDRVGPDGTPERVMGIVPEGRPNAGELIVKRMGPPQQQAPEPQAKMQRPDMPVVQNPNAGQNPIARNGLSDNYIARGAY